MRQRTLALVGGGLLVIAIALGGVTAALAWGPNSQTPPWQGGAGWGAGGYGPGGMMGRGGMMGGWGAGIDPSGSVTGTVPYGPGGMMGGRGMMGGWGPQAGITGTVPFGPGGMMGRGGMMGGWGQANPNAQPITLDQARQNLQAYVAQLGNADLAIGEVIEFPNHFYAHVEEKSTGNGAIELLVDRYNGTVFPEYGPSMMWNTKYGMMALNPWMGQMMGWQQPTAPVTISADQAKQIAAEWLAQNLPGTATEAPDVFPGYYTIHTLKDGKVSGMLSVNGYSGQVWYHTWHAQTPRPAGTQS